MILKLHQLVLIAATIAAGGGVSNDAVAAQTSWPGGKWQPYPAP